MAVFTATEALEMALEIEENGELFYNEASAKSTDAEVKELFEALAAQERGHYQVFQKMLEDVQPARELPATQPATTTQPAATLPAPSADSNDS